MKKYNLIIFLLMVITMLSVVSGCFHGQNSAAKGFTINGVSVDEYSIVISDMTEGS